MILERTIPHKETSTLMKRVIEIYHIQLGTECDSLQNQSQENYTDSAWLQQLKTSMENFPITIYQKKMISQTTQK